MYAIKPYAMQDGETSMHPLGRFFELQSEQHRIQRQYSMMYTFLDSYRTRILTIEEHWLLLQEAQIFQTIFDRDPRNLTVEQLRRQLIAWKREELHINSILEFLKKSIEQVQQFQEKYHPDQIEENAGKIYSRCRLCQRYAVLSPFDWPERNTVYLCETCYYWVENGHVEYYDEPRQWFVAGHLIYHEHDGYLLQSFLPQNPTFVFSHLITQGDSVFLLETSPETTYWSFGYHWEWLDDPGQALSSLQRRERWQKPLFLRDLAREQRTVAVVTSYNPE